jgi:hypothetical protein
LTRRGSANFPRFEKAATSKFEPLPSTTVAPHYTPSPTSLYHHPGHSRSCNLVHGLGVTLSSLKSYLTKPGEKGIEEMSAHAPTSRTREAPQGDEEASAELKLGEFQDVDALTHSEAALVINALVAKRSADRKNVNETEYALFLCCWREGWGGGE